MGTTKPRMGIISDVHAGYKYGIVPPRWRLKGEEAVDPTSKFQKYLWECWTHWAKTCPELDVLIMNGDCIHGEDRKDVAQNVISSDPIDQAEMFIEAMRPLRSKCGKLWLTRGTPYHSGRCAEAVEYAAKELGAESWGGHRHSGYSLFLEWQDLTFSISHHQTRGWLWLAGGGDRTSALHKAAEAQGKLPKADVIVRSHLHCKRIVWARDTWFISTPGWTVVSPWAAKVMESARAHESSDVGALVLTRDKETCLGFKFWDYPAHQETVRKA